MPGGRISLRLEEGLTSLVDGWVEFRQHWIAYSSLVCNGLSWRLFPLTSSSCAWLGACGFDLDRRSLLSCISLGSTRRPASPITSASIYVSLMCSIEASCLPCSHCLHLPLRAGSLPLLQAPIDQVGGNPRSWVLMPKNLVLYAGRVGRLSLSPSGLLIAAHPVRGVHPRRQVHFHPLAFAQVTLPLMWGGGCVELIVPAMEPLLGIP